MAEIVHGITKSLLVDNKSLHKLRSLKIALMQDLLTGKVRVTSLLTEQEISA
jgi:hypothetical protein